MAMTSQFGNMTSSSNLLMLFVFLVKFRYWSKFHVNIIVCSGVMTIIFCMGLSRIWKSEIPPSELCPISGDWGKLEISNLVRISLMKCYWKLPNSRVTTYIVSELLRENQQGRGSKIRVKIRIEAKKVHRVLEFNQSQWLKPYVRFKTQKRAEREKNGKRYTN